jgi:cysteine synthase B
LEPSSGNTGIALARLAAMEGLRLTVVAPDNVSRERLDLLEAFGAEVVFSPGAEGSNGAVRLAEATASTGSFLMLHQYENPANPRAHYLTTGPEILAGPPRIDAFVACLGTGGTLMGVGRALREAFPDVKVIGVEPPAGENIAGLRSMAEGYVPPIFDPKALDGRLLIGTEDAIITARRLLVEEGLFVGPSSGAAVHAAMRVAGRLPEGSVVVTILPDAGWKYLSTGIYEGATAELSEKVSGLTLW